MLHAVCVGASPFPLIENLTCPRNPGSGQGQGHLSAAHTELAQEMLGWRRLRHGLPLRPCARR